MANDATLTLPALTISAEGGPANSASATLTLPAFAVEAATNGIVLPAFTMEGAASSHEVIALPALTLEATASAGVVASAAITLPALECSAGTPIQVALTLPALTVESSGTAGQVATANLTLAALTLDGAASTPLVGTADLSVPLPVVTGSALTGNVGAASITLASLALAAEGVSGTIATAELTLPVLEMDASAGTDTVGIATLTLPALTLTATAGEAASSSYTAYALNTESRALTTYSNMPIRGLARFNGVYLAAGPGGLFTLGGDLDDTAVINATARLAQTDFGDVQLKRVAAMYVHYRTDGDLNLKVITDEDETYDYTLEAAGHQTLSPGRVKIGRGLKGAYWTFELSNRDGADFEIDRLTIDPVSTSRRVG